MAGLTVEEFRAFVTTSLGDEPLQILLDAAWESIEDLLGPGAPTYDAPDAVNELVTVHGDLLMLSRAAETIESILEGTTELDPDDYEVRSSGRILRRLRTGTHPASRWGEGWPHRGRVNVTYTPLSDAANRQRVQMELVKLDLGFTPGTVSERIGDWSETFTQGATDYPAQRSAILASLQPALAGVW